MALDLIDLVCNRFGSVRLLHVFLNIFYQVLFEV